MSLPFPQSVLSQHIIALGKTRSDFGPAPRTVVPSEVDKAYAAGFFDGEGNVCIAANRAAGERGIYTIYNMRIGVSQKDPEVLFWLRDRWGGSIRRCKNENHMWNCFSRGALVFLCDTFDYLRVKRERAQLAIDYQSRIAVYPPFGRRGRTPERTAMLEAAKAEMNRLNAKSNRGFRAR